MVYGNLPCTVRFQIPTDAVNFKFQQFRKCLYSTEWNDGMEWWNGMEWNGVVAGSTLYVRQLCHLSVQPRAL